MENKEISETHDALIKHAAKSKKNFSQLAEDANDHVTAHVNLVKDKTSDTLDQVTEYAREIRSTSRLARLGLGSLLASLVRNTPNHEKIER